MLNLEEGGTQAAFSTSMALAASCPQTKGVRILTLPPPALIATLNCVGPLLPLLYCARTDFAKVGGVHDIRESGNQAN